MRSLVVGVALLAVVFSFASSANAALVIIDNYNDSNTYVDQVNVAGTVSVLGRDAGYLAVVGDGAGAGTVMNAKTGELRDIVVNNPNHSGDFNVSINPSSSGLVVTNTSLGVAPPVTVTITDYFSSSLSTLDITDSGNNIGIELQNVFSAATTPVTN